MKGILSYHFKGEIEEYETALEENKLERKKYCFCLPTLYIARWCHCNSHLQLNCNFPFGIIDLPTFMQRLMNESTCTNGDKSLIHRPSSSGRVTEGTSGYSFSVLLHHLIFFLTSYHSHTLLVHCPLFENRQFSTFVEHDLYPACHCSFKWLGSRADWGGSSGEGPHRTVTGLLVTSYTEAEVKPLSA